MNILFASAVALTFSLSKGYVMIEKLGSPSGMISGSGKT